MYEQIKRLLKLGRSVIIVEKGTQMVNSPWLDRYEINNLDELNSIKDLDRFEIEEIIYGYD